MVMSEVSSSHHLSDEPLRCFEGKENADVAKVVGKRKRQKRDSPQCCFTNNLDNGSAVVGDGVTDDSGAKNGSVLVVSNENIVSLLYNWQFTTNSYFFHCFAQMATLSFCFVYYLITTIF